MFLSVNYCVTWKICVHCTIMLKKERCVNTLYRFWECILVFVKEMCHLNGQVACEKEIFEWCFVKSLTVRPVVKQTLVL